MNDQHYAGPDADLKPNTTDIAHLMQPLLRTKPWVRLCSIMGFISGVFMILAAFGVMASGSLISGASPYGQGFAVGIGIVYLLLGIVYFFPSFYLFKYASAIAAADLSQNMMDVAQALERQKSFWKFAGIMMLIMIVVFVLGIVSAIVIPMMAR